MFTIDSTSSTPPFGQLKRQVISLITSGTLPLGAKLPAVRTLAYQLGLAPNTVARAYRELEHEGFLRTQGRNGTTVAARLDDAETHDRALELTREYTAAMTALGVTHAEIGGYLDLVPARE
jgi:GntR family transcriptional regulator